MKCRGVVHTGDIRISEGRRGLIGKGITWTIMDTEMVNSLGAGAP